jgi:hypothetical protein
MDSYFNIAARRFQSDPLFQQKFDDAIAVLPLGYEYFIIHRKEHGNKNKMGFVDAHTTCCGKTVPMFIDLVVKQEEKQTRFNRYQMSVDPTYLPFQELYYPYKLSHHPDAHSHHATDCPALKSIPDYSTRDHITIGDHKLILFRRKWWATCCQKWVGGVDSVGHRSFALTAHFARDHDENCPASDALHHKYWGDPCVICGTLRCPRDQACTIRYVRKLEARIAVLEEN